MKFILRNGNKEDASSITRLEPLIFGDPWTEDMVRSDLEAPISTYVIAEADGEVLGYIGYWKVLDECQINNVGVVPWMQRQGLGHMILSHVLKTTEEEGVKVWLLEVRAGNDPAINLYLKHGFKSIGIRRGYYEDGEDAVVMRRDETYKE